MANNIQLSKDYLSRCSEKTLQSNENGFFLQFADKVEEVAGNNWINDVFGKLKSDKDRLRILYKFEPVREVLCETLSRVQEIYRQKDASVSRSRRVAAEKLEKDGELQKALLLYCQSVLRAPGTGEEPRIDDGFTLSLAYWSRSKLLMKLKHYSEAITDIQLAMKEELTDDHHAEVYKNMALCYKSLRDVPRAKISIAIAEKMLRGDANKIATFREEFEKQPVAEVTKNQKHLPVIPEGQKNDLPNASSKITVDQESSKGRYMIAKEDIRTGDTLVVQAPYASCLLPDFFGSHCHHCFEKLLSPVGCKDCSSVAFCKPECRDAALNTYHKYECRFLDLIIGSGMSILSHTALRMVTQFGLDKCLKIYQNRDKEEVYQLCTNWEKRSTSDFLQRAVMSAFLLRILQKSGFFKDGCANEEVMPEEEEYQIGELLLYHLQMLQFNAHEIYETRQTPDCQLKDVKVVYIGVAIYPTVALFNHDCYPSVLRYFVGKHIVIKASRPINPKEVVSENYGPIFTWKNLEERQKSLAGRYWFQCQCLACTQNWPSIKNGLRNVTKKITCPSETCHLVFTLPLKNETVNCSNCKKKVNLSKRVAEYQVCEELYDQGKACYLNKEIDKGIDIICKAIDLYHRISVPPHCETHLAQETLRALYAQSGSVFEVGQLKPN
ncbi:histone-lysine N-methyltransferase ASHR1 [Agrilus planipennis]|uniref:Protein-lysine N-methyltransferase SMYD4 n=1 Tax=Agrilus planipennis TaxID=224129 RepID=A0A7F5RJV2_AGRPL|nr:histone-lysine N-methyltransferase ASHR1 [Agrilus planipennis]